MMGCGGMRVIAFLLNEAYKWRFKDTEWRKIGDILWNVWSQIMSCTRVKTLSSAGRG